MAAQHEPEIVLYDLASTKNICFSPAVWRIRLMLNYKQIPYKTIFLEFPDIEPTLKELGIPPNPSGPAYTVPAIYHIPTKTYLMDSTPIAHFLDSTYPSPPFLPPTDHDTLIQSRARAAVGPAIRISIPPRELHILSPRSQEYFRRTREAALGHPLEELIEGGKEDEVWRGAEDAMKEVSGMLMERENEGLFGLLREWRPSQTDFWIAGAMQAARLVDEGVYRRIVEFHGFADVYSECTAWMGKMD